MKNIRTEKTGNEKINQEERRWQKSWTKEEVEGKSCFICFTVQEIRRTSQVSNCCVRNETFLGTLLFVHFLRKLLTS